MKFYLAARYTRREEMLACAEDLNSLGHEVTSRWIKGGHQMGHPEPSSQADAESRERFAEEDLEDVCRADCLVTFTEEPRKTNSRGGRHVEYGIALGQGKTVIVVGPRENVFHHLPDVSVFANWAGAMTALEHHLPTLCGMEA